MGKRQNSLKKYIMRWCGNMVVSAEERYPAYTFAVTPCTPLCFGNNNMDVMTVSCTFHQFELSWTLANE